MRDWLTIPFSELADRLTRSLNDLQREQGSEASSSWLREIVQEIVNDLRAVKRLRSDIQDLATEADKQKTPTMQVKRWLVNLKALSFDAEEILEEYEYELHQVQLNAEGFDSEVRALTTSTSLSREFLEEIKNRVRNIKERLDEMYNMRRDLGLVGREGKIEEPLVRPETGFFPSRSDICGRDDNKKQLKAMLMTIPEDVPVSVIVLIGAGGVGKTTIAQHVYGDEAIIHFFDKRAWVCVSDVFNVKKIARDAVGALTGKKTSEHMTVAKLQEILRDEFITEKEKKKKTTFLLVLDDVWNEDPNLWEQLDFLLRFGDTGSKILVTTRSENVALAMQPMRSHHYCLDRLTNEQSLQLLRELAFGRVDPADKRREDIAGRIADKCIGSPLAITVIGKLLRKEDKVSEWENIRDSELWEIDDEKQNIRKTLELSYAYLPMHLKQCFLYCSAFPKDHAFAEEDLIRIWMAQGMIRGESLEDEGAKCFKGLLQRSFLIKTNVEESFVLHDLMHDLAQYILKEELSLLYDESETTKLADRFKLGRELTINEFNELNEQQLDHARHLFLEHDFNDDDEYADDDDEVVHFSSRKILRMKHLRYLKSSIFFDQVLLNSLGRLFNLQTLDIPLDSDMPKGMCMLKNLRHLKISEACFDSECHFPKGFGRLTNLRTLNLFIVTEGEYCTIADLKDLRYLRGCICIEGLANVIKADEAKEAQLDDKPDIRELVLFWDRDKGRREDDEVLENLQPHASLEKLTIYDFQGLKLPSWLGNRCFTNLIKVRLERCKNCKSLPGLGQLPCLQDVWIQRFPCIERVGPEFYGHVEAFSQLRCLSFVHMHNLKKFCEYDACKFPRLEYLRLIDCPVLQVPPIIRRRPTALRTLNVMQSTSLIRWSETEEGKTALDGVELYLG